MKQRLGCWESLVHSYLPYFIYSGQRWDQSIYKLALATEEDSQGSTRIPYGLIVEYCTIPDFTYEPNELSFAFVPLLFGSGKRLTERDRYLQVELPVYRSSGHYDRSIMPILALLNIVAITCLPRNFDSATASTETMLSIAFVQVGIRLTIDSRLPSVGYQIKFQKVISTKWRSPSLSSCRHLISLTIIKRPILILLGPQPVFLADLWVGLGIQCSILLGNQTGLGHCRYRHAGYCRGLHCSFLHWVYPFAVLWRKNFGISCKFPIMAGGIKKSCARG